MRDNPLFARPFKKSENIRFYSRPLVIFGSNKTRSFRQNYAPAVRLSVWRRTAGASVRAMVIFSRSVKSEITKTA